MCHISNNSTTKCSNLMDKLRAASVLATNSTLRTFTSTLYVNSRFQFSSRIEYRTYSCSTFASVNIFLDALVSVFSRCLSEKYKTFLIPDWMMSFAQLLQGNRATYMVQFLTSAEFLFMMAFISAWQTLRKRDKDDQQFGSNFLFQNLLLI